MVAYGPSGRVSIYASLYGSFQYNMCAYRSSPTGTANVKKLKRNVKPYAILCDYMLPYVAVGSLGKLEEPYVAICCYMRPYITICEHN